jgi:hypothetical protein
MGHLSTVWELKSEITPVRMSVWPSRTRTEPVSRRLTLKILIGPQPVTGVPGVLADTEGDKLKVTKPLSSILLTLAPKVNPAVPKFGVQAITFEEEPVAADETL